jgi:hypothetical protein
MERHKRAGSEVAEPFKTAGVVPRPIVFVVATGRVPFAIELSNWWHCPARSSG